MWGGVVFIIWRRLDWFNKLFMVWLYFIKHCLFGVCCGIMIWMGLLFEVSLL
jgi:hypothetical protein